jgi:hypothetical protein
MILFSQGRDGRGWGRVSRKLSKALAFFGATTMSLSSNGAQVGKSLGKVPVLLSFVKVVSLPVFVLDVGPLVLSAADWCAMEKFITLGREREMVW